MEFLLSYISFFPSENQLYQAIVIVFDYRAKNLIDLISFHRKFLKWKLFIPNSCPSIAKDIVQQYYNHIWIKYDLRSSVCLVISMLLTKSSFPLNGKYFKLSCPLFFFWFRLRFYFKELRRIEYRIKSCLLEWVYALKLESVYERGKGIEDRVGNSRRWDM